MADGFNLMNWLRKHRNTILLATVGGFVLSTLIGFGLYSRTASPATETAVDVNGKSISYQEYANVMNRAVNSVRTQGAQITPEVNNQIKQEVVQSLVQGVVFSGEAERYGVDVTDVELANSLATIPAFQKGGKFDPQTYVQSLHYGMHATPKEFEKSHRQQIAVQHLRSIVMQGVKVTDDEVRMAISETLATSAPKDRAKIESDFQKNPNEFREKLRQEKVAQVLALWYQQLGANLKIKVNVDEIEKRQKG